MLKHEEPQQRGGNKEVAIEEASTCYRASLPPIGGDGNYTPRSTEQTKIKLQPYFPSRCSCSPYTGVKQSIAFS